MKTIHAWTLAIIFLSVSLAGCNLPVSQARQEKSDSYWPELLSGQSYGQTFVSERSHLYRIDLATVTFARNNTCGVIFYLRTDPSSDQDIVRVELPCSSVENDRPTTIVFPPISDSQGKEYYFYIESPDAAPGNAVSLLVRNDQGAYSNGTAYRNHQPVEADIAFTAYSEEIYSLSRVLNDIGSRIAQDPVFALIYLVIVVVLTGFQIRLSVRKKLDR